MIEFIGLVLLTVVKKIKKYSLRSNLYIFFYNYIKYIVFTTRCIFLKNYKVHNKNYVTNVKRRDCTGEDEDVFMEIYAQ